MKSCAPPDPLPLLNGLGHATHSSGLSEARLAILRTDLFRENSPGSRCLLDLPSVAEMAIELRSVLVVAGYLPAAAKAIQAIAFNKTSAVNWKVTWHQDLMFPFARPVSAEGFSLPTKKDGVDYARPPREVLESLLAVRLHLDDCDETNGPLRVSPGSHRHGLIPSQSIPDLLSRYGEATCLTQIGDMLLLKPLLLHASSVATAPKHRRVLHLVYHSGRSITESWHREV